MPQCLVLFALFSPNICCCVVLWPNLGAHMGMHLEQHAILGAKFNAQGAALNTLRIVSNSKTLYNFNASLGFSFTIGLN